MSFPSVPANSARQTLQGMALYVLPGSSTTQSRISISASFPGLAAARSQGQERPRVLQAEPPMPMSTWEYNELRKKLGRTIVGMAEVIGVTKRHAQRYAHGHQTIPEPVARLLRSLAGRSRNTRSRKTDPPPR
jgi:hypothetical protein